MFVVGCFLIIFGKFLFIALFNKLLLTLFLASISLVTQSTLAAFNRVDECVELCGMRQQHIDECCAAYGHNQNGYCTRLFGKQVRCEPKDMTYLEPVTLP